jgi:deazaflavin-dependent oxidoreductase (nitroreductase family)
VWVRNHLVNPVVRVLARTPARRLLWRPLVLLRYTGRRTGRRFELPVMAAQAGEDLVMVAGQHDAKKWWRNFGAAPQEVTVRFQGDLQRRSARRLWQTTPATPRPSVPTAESSRASRWTPPRRCSSWLGALRSTADRLEDQPPGTVPRVPRLTGRCGGRETSGNRMRGGSSGVAAGRCGRALGRRPSRVAGRPVAAAAVPDQAVGGKRSHLASAHRTFDPERLGRRTA